MPHVGSSGSVPPREWELDRTGLRLLQMNRRTWWAAAVLLTTLAAACSNLPNDDALTEPTTTLAASAETAPAASPTTTAPADDATPDVTPDTDPAPADDGPGDAESESEFARPAWLGTRPLPLRDDGHGEVRETPPELTDRRIATPALLPPPQSNDYTATISPIPDDVAGRSSWVEECPVTLDDLAYITLSHHGFDGAIHTGELIVNASVAEDVVWVFEQLFDAAFPIEQMRVITKDEIDAPPTGDWNDTTSFVCRPAVGSTRWSQHAFGLAIDINPFHNPYVKGDLVLPELASAYLDRDRDVPGMIMRNDVAFQAFAEIGWGWGGDWNSLKDWMHFSQSGN